MIETLFGTNETPVQTDASDTTSLNLGTLFRSVIAGDVVGGRWFTPATFPTVTPHLTLYRYDSESSGTVLAEMDLAAYTLAAWNTFQFPARVPIAAGALHVLSVWSNRYTATAHKFSADVVSGNLVGPADNVIGAGRRNGRYVYGPPTYPTSSYNETGYFVDPLFDAAPVNTPDIRASSSQVVAAGRLSTSGVAPWSSSSPAVAGGRSSAPGVV